MKINLIVTRHPGLVEYLRELGLAEEGVEVISHASPQAVAGRHVCGVLPHSLSCLTASFTEVPLALPAELRGAELSLEQVRAYASTPVTYFVRCAQPQPESLKWENRLGHRGRKARLILVDGKGSLYNFAGSPIEGVCKSRVLEAKQDGKWSSEVYELRLLGETRVAWQGREDFETSRIGSREASTWVEMAAQWGVNESELRAFLPSISRATADFLSALE